MLQKIVSTKYGLLLMAVVVIVWMVLSAVLILNGHTALPIPAPDLMFK